MEKANNDSRCFSTKFLAKKYFLFLFITVAFIANGFFVFRVEASETNVLEGILEEDTHWTMDGSPYLISSSLNVATGVTLTIDPGVVVKLGGTLYVSGKIIANGESGNEIYFTSLYDDVGGITNTEEYCDYENYDEEGNPIGDMVCNTTNPEPSIGDWGYIIINSAEKSIFNNVVERYSNYGLILQNGGSVDSNNFNSDNGISIYSGMGSSSSFIGLKITELEIGGDSHISIEDAVISNPEGEVITIYNNSSLNLKNTKVEGGEVDYPLSIFSYSSAVFNDVEISGNSSIYTPLVGVWSDSSLEINESNITSIIGDALHAFLNSSITATDLYINSANDGINIFSDSSLNFSGGEISYSNHGIYIFGESTANIDNIKISGTLGDESKEGIGVYAHSNTISDPIIITNSEITGNKYGFLVFGTSISASENSIHNNELFGAMTYDVDPLTLNVYDFKNNFWGDKTGPIHSSNPDGVGDIVSDNILFSPFLKFDPLIPQRNPVILIPGITGTYLNKNYDDKSEIWPNILKIMMPGEDSFLNDLSLNFDGTEKVEYPIVPGDIIRGISTIHVFDGLIEELTNAGYEEGTDLFVFPYDWRFSTESTAKLLKEKIDKIILDTGYENVDIVAHSMGGLVAKKYIADYGEDKIDQLIFLGTPQLGAPKAFKVLNFGDDMSYGFNLSENIRIKLLNSNRVKYISQNMPSVYELLPSEKYVESNGSYVTNSMDKDNPINLDYDQTKGLMIEKGRNLSMFYIAEDLHNEVDSLDLSNIETHNFVGCGSKTIGGITVKQKRLWNSSFFKWYDDYDLKYVNGDETVPLVSSNQVIGSDVHFVKNITHGSLPSADGVKESVLTILLGNKLPSSPNLIDDVSICNVSGEVVSTHSPVELHIYDEKGNHVGINAGGDIEYGIEGVQYDTIDEENYAFLPDGLNYKIVIKAKDTGGYSFKIEDEDSEDNITNNYKWTLIPLKTLNSSGEIWIGPDYDPSDYEVAMDDDGDGTIDKSYSVSYDGTEEAELAMANTRESRRISSGSIPLSSNTLQSTKIQDQVMDPLISKVIEDKIELKEDSDHIKPKQEISDFQKDPIITEDKGSEANNILVPTDNNGINKNLKLIILILCGVSLVILLAKKFLKL